MNGNTDKDAGVEGTLRRVKNALDSGKSALADMTFSFSFDDGLKSETESVLEESSYDEETVYSAEENMNDDTFNDASQSIQSSGSSYDEVTVDSDEDTTGRDKLEDSAESVDLPNFFTPPSQESTDEANKIDIPMAEASNKEELFIFPETDNEAGSMADYNTTTGDYESEFTEETVSGNEECDESFNDADVSHHQAAEDESEFSEETVPSDDGSEFTEETVSGYEKIISDIDDMVQKMAISETPAMTLSSEGTDEEEYSHNMPLSIQHNLQVSEERGSISGWGTMDTKDQLTHTWGVATPSEKSLTTNICTADAKEEESQPIPVHMENDLQNNVAEQKSDIRRVKLASYDQLAPPKAEPATADEIIRANQRPPTYQKIDWIEASPDIEELLKGVTGSSLPRRTNACGAINVLVSTETERHNLARTKGLLDALAFAASERVPNLQIAVALDGRIRAVEAILHLAELKENRKLIFSHKGIVQSLLRVLTYGPGQARVHACKTLALLAKHTENRVGMTNEDELVAKVTLVLSGKCDYNAVGIVLENEEEEFDSLGEGIGTYTFDDTSVLSFNQFHSAITEDDWWWQEESSYESQEESSYESSESDDISETSDREETEYSNSYLDSSTIPTFEDGHGKYEKYLSLAKMSACAILMHLSNHCTSSYALGQNKMVVETLVSASLEFDNPLHTKCIEILCNLTRFRPNTSSLAQDCDLVTALAKCAQSKVREDSMWSLRSIQNLTTDPSARKILATPTIVSILSAVAMQTDSEGHPAAVSALFNLCSDPQVIGPMTNTKNVIVTLIHLTHSPSINSDIREMAAGSLASIASCLQTLAACGTVPKGVPNIKLPSHTAVGWERWDGH
eukprot:scaffold18524_cov56-Attheya_sp.AAC.4